MTEQPKPPSEPEWALITNASPGTLAEALAIAFRAHKINVIATSSSTSKAVEHISPTIGTLEGFLIKLYLDTRSSKAVASAVELVSQLTNGRLSFLVNCPNATSTESGALLDVDIAQAKKTFDVNVWAPLAVTQAFFPLLRAGNGVVVNQTSVTGLQGYSRPFIGINSSSNAAMMSLNDVMRLEFEPFEVKVVGLVLSAVKIEGSTVRSGKMSQRSPYVLIEDDVEHLMMGSESTGHDRFEAAGKIVGALLQERTPTFVRLGYLATMMWLLHWLLPVWSLDAMHRYGSGLAKLKMMLNADDKKDE